MKFTMTLLAILTSLSANAGTYRCVGEAGTRLNISSNSTRAGLVLTAGDGETFRCILLLRRAPRVQKTAVRRNHDSCTCVGALCTGGDACVADLRAHALEE